VATREQILAALKAIVLPGSSEDIVSAGLVSDIADRRRCGDVRHQCGSRPGARHGAGPIGGREGGFVFAGRQQGDGRAHRRTRSSPRSRRQPQERALSRPRKCGAASPAFANHRGRLRQGRRRQIDHRGQSRARPARSRPEGRRARCRHLRPVGAEAARHPRKPQTLGGTRLKPMERYGLKVMSIGFLVEEETPMIWRGPMVMSALTADAARGGVGHARRDGGRHAARHRRRAAHHGAAGAAAGAVIVSTPQDLALIDARRGSPCSERVNVPVLGIVENMSYFVCPKCGTRSDIFGHGGARNEARRARMSLPVCWLLRAQPPKRLPPSTRRRTTLLGHSRNQPPSPVNRGMVPKKMRISFMLSRSG
jgi:hypothetical protein